MYFRPEEIPGNKLSVSRVCAFTFRVAITFLIETLRKRRDIDIKESSYGDDNKKKIQKLSHSLVCSKRIPRVATSRCN